MTNVVKVSGLVGAAAAVAQLIGFSVPGVAALASYGTWAVLALFFVSLVLFWKGEVSKNVDASGKVVSKVTSGPSLLTVGHWYGTKDVAKDADEYVRLHNESDGGSLEARKSNYMKMVNQYYDLVTDFYEYGWGKSFHFGRRFNGEDFDASLARHEQWLGYRAGFQPGMKVIDVGCGVGGPMRAIARFTGATIIGINNNAYQIKRGTVQNEEAGLSHLCSFKQSDFMALDFEENSLDGAYAIEATCHAPDKVACFREIARVLKPGAVFAGYEWCMTDKYDAKNAEHQKIKKMIEEGDSLPDIAHTSEVIAALEAAGFEVVEHKDVGELEPQNSVPWYATIDASGCGLQALKNFRASKFGTAVTHSVITVLEFLRLAPRGTTATHTFLTNALKGLVAGGKTGIFTPMFYFKAVKK